MSDKPNSFSIDEQIGSGESHVKQENYKSSMKQNNDSHINSKLSVESKESEEAKQAPSELIDAVIEYLKCDDELHEISIRQKELRNQRKELEDKVLVIMESMNEEVLETSSGKLSRTITRTKATVNVDHVKNMLSREMNESEAGRLSALVFEERPVKEKILLKRNRPKNPKK